MTTRLMKVCTVHGWDVVVRHFDDGRPTDWLATPHGHAEGPVIVFKTFTAAQTYAERYEVATDSRVQ